MILDEVDPATRAMLERHAFDADPRSSGFGAELVAGTLIARAQRRPGRRRAAAAGDLTPMPAPARGGFDEAATAAGCEALRAGAIAVVVLAGGMATRFGGGVKAVAEAIDGRSFLEVKLGETRRLADALVARSRKR